MENRKPPIVSIIIPVYNVELWLRDCLDSAVSQSLQEIEIICVNDGSTDASPEILHEYAASDSRIHIVDQENKGLSEARNAGVRAATGKYLYFLDSDDILETDAVRLCVENMEQRGLDYLCFNAAAFGTDTESARTAGKKNSKYYRRFLNSDKIYTGQELFVELKQSGHYVASVCISMTRGDFFLKNSLWFYPGILHEDELWTFHTLMCAERAGCLNLILYRRRIRENSIVTASVSFRHAYGCFVVSREAEKRLTGLPVSTSSEYMEAAVAHITRLQSAAIKKYRACSEEEQNKYRNLSLEDQILFRQMVVYPAALIDQVEQETDSNRELCTEFNQEKEKRKKLQSDKKRLSREKKKLQRDKKVLQRKISAIKHSGSYRIGRVVTWFPRKLHATFRKEIKGGNNRDQQGISPKNADVTTSNRSASENSITILPSTVLGNHIVYHYEMTGEWRSCFAVNKSFEITYPFSLEEIPESVRIIPFLANLLPASWVCNAEIRVPECDKDFYECLDAVRAGFQNMYPMLHFGGQLEAEQIETNQKTLEEEKALICFSGGVDALHTTLSHLTETPTLVTLWGADVPWNDEDGWHPLENQLRSDAEMLALDWITVRSSFRDLFREGELSRRVRTSGDKWWHGFQHGLGTLGHMAPVAYQLGASKIYIAASFTAEDVYTCGSDPTIDNHLQFFGTKVVHDGFDADRQKKIKNIVDYSKKTDIAIPVHVCWKKHGGDNCCHCEKCWRTMLGFVAEGADPKKHGFAQFDGFASLSGDMEESWPEFQIRAVPNYTPIQKRMHERISRNQIPRELEWFYDADLQAVQDGILSLHNGRMSKTAWLFGTIEHTNLGDHCITVAELSFLGSCFPDLSVHEVSENELVKGEFKHLDSILPGQLIFLQGGGDIGSIWPKHDGVRGRIIHQMSNNPIVIFPQSIFYSGDEEGREALARAKSIYQGENVLLCCRDSISYAFAQEQFSCRSILLPDMVMREKQKTETPMERSGALTLLRSDRERKITDEDNAEIEKILSQKFGSFESSDMVIKTEKHITKETRQEKISTFITRLSAAECVVTDRLHGMVLCAVTGTPCVAMGNSYHKIRAGYEWLKDLGYIRYIEDVGELDEAVDAVCSCTDREYPEELFQRRFDVLKQCIQEITE